MQLKYIPPKKLKVLIIMFFVAAAFGIFVGLVIAKVVKDSISHCLELLIYAWVDLWRIF